jgi:hypothetical protein
LIIEILIVEIGYHYFILVFDLAVLLKTSPLVTEDRFVAIPASLSYFDVYIGLLFPVFINLLNCFQVQVLSVSGSGGEHG